MLSPWLAAAARLPRELLDAWCARPFVSEPNASEDVKASLLRGDAAQLIARFLTPKELTAFLSTHRPATNSEKLAADYLWALIIDRDYRTRGGMPIRRREVADSPTWISLLPPVRARMVSEEQDVTHFWQDAYLELSGVVRAAYLTAFFEISANLERFNATIKWSDDEGHHRVREPSTQFVQGREPRDGGDFSILSWQIASDDAPHPTRQFDWFDPKKGVAMLQGVFQGADAVITATTTPAGVNEEEERYPTFRIATWAYEIIGRYPVFQLESVEAADALALMRRHEEQQDWIWWYAVKLVKKYGKEANVVDPEHHSIAAYAEQLNILYRRPLYRYLRDAADVYVTDRAFATELGLRGLARGFNPESPAPPLRPTLYLSPVHSSSTTSSPPTMLACSTCKQREATLAIVHGSVVSFACEPCRTLPFGT
jgi:hypothetical protein